MQLRSWGFSKPLYPGLFAVVLLLAVFATAVTADAHQPAPPPKATTDQAWLAHEVRHRLVVLPFYSLFDNLEYRVEGNRVLLMGQVVRPELKQDARAAVEQIEGVESVDNQIEVLPPSPMDDQIRRAEFHAVYGTPGFEIYRSQSVQPIHIIVKNGHVTLEGVVASTRDRNLAGIAANQVPNVFSVTNNLRVENG
jgi:hyperosmotically inducible periplasmic protein